MHLAGQVQIALSVKNFLVVLRMAFATSPWSVSAKMVMRDTIVKSQNVELVAVKITDFVTNLANVGVRLDGQGQGVRTVCLIQVISQLSLLKKKTNPKV